MRFLGNVVKTTHIDELFCKLDNCDRVGKQPCEICENLDVRAIRREDYRKVKTI